MDFIFDISNYNIGVIYMITRQTKLYRKSSTNMKILMKHIIDV